MTMVLNEEQVQLQDAAKKFIQEQCPVSALRELRDNNDSTGFDKATWQAMAELGWAGILISEEQGGLGLSPLWMGLIMEEAGRGLAASPLLSSAILSTSLIQQLGSEAQKSNCLEAMASGELLISLASDEGHHHQAQNIQCQAAVEGDTFTLNGQKTMVLDGHIANKLIIAARTSGEATDTDGISLFLCDADTQGISIKRESLIDSRNIASISLDQVKLSQSELLGQVDKAYPALKSCLDIANACLSAEMLGTIQEAFDRIIDYLKTRTQFDTLIGSFQALQHRAAEMFGEIELSKSAVRAALSSLDEGSAHSSRSVCIAKVQVCNTAKMVAADSIQMFGGIGMTDEEEIGLFFKRLKVASQLLGNADYHKKCFADLSGF